MTIHRPIHRPIRSVRLLASLAILAAANFAIGQDTATRVYENRLTRIRNPKPLLADYPEFVQPVVESRRFQAPMLVEDEDGDLDVRTWRYSYNARGIIEMPNRLRAKKRR